MHNNLQTEAGQTKRPDTKNKSALIDAINQVFTLFRLNYHNQYLKAFGNTEELNEVKRLWLEMLGRFSASTLLSAAKTIIENSEYLPTLHTMIYYCEKNSSDGNLPDAHGAYIEACRAPSPKATYKWSHLAVYHAGKACDWHFLQSSPESIAFPIYKKKYQDICESIRGGALLETPAKPAIEHDTKEKTVSKEDAQQRLTALKSSLNL